MRKVLLVGFEKMLHSINMLDSEKKTGIIVVWNPHYPHVILIQLSENNVCHCQQLGLSRSGLDNNIIIKNKTIAAAGVLTQ